MIIVIWICNHLEAECSVEQLLNQNKLDIWIYNMICNIIY